MQKAIVTTYNSNEELENARALQASKNTYTERFYMLMKLIKISSMISNAKIVQAPQIGNNNK
ncbi:MAG: hypothetical protein WCI49_07180 [Ferruginibacter sp.]